MKSYEILLGLPGSGKTRYATSQKKKYKNIIVYDADTFMLEANHTLQDLADEILSIERNTHIIIDGLFPEGTSNTLRDWLSQGPEECYITYFNAKQEICLANDRYRYENGERDKLATNTIKSMRILEMKYDKLIETRTPYILYNTIINDDGYLGIVKSEDWDAGGSTFASCWDDEDTEHIPTEPDVAINLNEFNEFMEYREKYTGLSEEVFIEKYGHLVTIGEDSEGDYYGGCYYSEFYTFDRVTLLSAILEIEPETLEEHFKEERPGDYIKLVL